MSSEADFSKAIDITKQMGAHSKTMMKPKDIPIYGEKNVSPANTNVQEAGPLLSTVKETRLAVQGVYHQMQDVVLPIRDNAKTVIETGKAHTQATYQMIRDEDNVLVHAALIGGSGLIGFMIASFAKRARFVKRLLFTGVGAGVAASICYPPEAAILANSAFEETKRLGLIAYNFVQGVKPNEDAKKSLVVVANSVKVI